MEPIHVSFIYREDKKENIREIKTEKYCFTYDTKTDLEGREWYVAYVTPIEDYVCTMEIPYKVVYGHHTLRTSLYFKASQVSEKVPEPLKKEKTLLFDHHTYVYALFRHGMNTKSLFGWYPKDTDTIHLFM